MPLEGRWTKDEVLHISWVMASILATTPLGRRGRSPSAVEVLIICDVTGPRAKSRGARTSKQATPPAPLQKERGAGQERLIMAPLPQAKCPAANVLFTS